MYICTSFITRPVKDVAHVNIYIVFGAEGRSFASSAIRVKHLFHKIIFYLTPGSKLFHTKNFK